MAIEVVGDKAICCRCGTAYGRRKGYFPVSYAALYKGVGYLPYCRNCIDTMYNEYLSSCGDAKMAVRQMCRKLDLYWNASVFDSVEKKATTRTMMTNYISRINNISYAGKCYDDTLISDGTMWDYEGEGTSLRASIPLRTDSEKDGEVTIDDISDGVLEYWGPGYTPEMYQDLEQRRNYWMNNLPDGIVPDIGMEARIRQICNLELDINRMRAAGKATDKQAAQLSKLITDMNLDPASRGEDSSAFDKTPFGVWIDRWEFKRPVPEADEDLQDFDGIVKYISTWLLGHLCAMFGIKNKNTRLYEEKMAEMRVERGITDEDDDEEVFNLVFPGEAGDEG